jgi:hypothetical protein
MDSLLNILRLYLLQMVQPNLEAIIETSVTLGYQARQWGATRIALDGIQNHLPSDSGGSSVHVEFQVNGRWLSFDQRDIIDPEKVQAIRFGDDGRGFSYELLGVFHSTKAGDHDSVGQFGEGIKMLSAACLREGVDLELRSRNWFAHPRVKSRIIDGEKVDQMCYDVYNHQPDMQGSMTTFRNPSSDFVNLVLNLQDKVRILGEKNAELFRSEQGDIVDTQGRVYVKGVHVTDSFQDNLLYSYDLAHVDTNRDRDTVQSHELNNTIREIFSDVQDRTIMRRILGKAAEDKEYMEFGSLFWHKSANGSTSGSVNSRHPDIWKSVFHELYGEDTLLTSVDKWGDSWKERDMDRMARIMGHEVVGLNPDVAHFLGGCGVPNSESVKSDEHKRLLQGEDYDPSSVSVSPIQTSVTLGYRATKWGPERLILDALANHMPADSGGTSVPTIEYLVSDAYGRTTWTSREQRKTGSKVKGIKFSDDGRGYTPKFLELLHSTKSEDVESVGQFGEGLKLLAAAYLREKEISHGLDLKLRSRNWVAIPFSNTEDLGTGSSAKRLNFRLAQGLNAHLGSATTIFEPTFSMVEVVDVIEKNVLAYNPDYKPIVQASSGVLFDGTNYEANNVVANGTIFIKDFFVTDDLKDSLMFSYNLTIADINPDRDSVNEGVMRESVRRIVRSCRDDKVIDNILQKAENNERALFEFQTIQFNAQDQDLAKQYETAFHRVFGENAVVFTENPDLFAQAIHRGYKPVILQEGVRNTLINAGVTTDKEIVYENFVPTLIDLSELSDREQKMLDRYKEIDTLMGVSDTGQPKIYAKLQTRGGKVLPYPGFFHPAKGIHLRRDCLSSPWRFVDVYKHEKGHEVSDASDPEDAFRQVFENVSTTYILAELEGRARVVTTHAAEQDMRQRFEHYETRIGELQAEAEKQAEDYGARVSELQNATREQVQDYQRKLSELEAALSEAKTRPRRPFANPFRQIIRTAKVRPNLVAKNERILEQMEGGVDTDLVAAKNPIHQRAVDAYWNTRQTVGNLRTGVGDWISDGFEKGIKWLDRFYS